MTTLHRRLISGANPTGVAAAELRDATPGYLLTRPRGEVAPMLRWRDGPTDAVVRAPEQAEDTWPF